MNPNDPSDVRYVCLRTARRAMEGLREATPCWAINAARDALLPLERDGDFRLPEAVRGARTCLEAACRPDLSQRALVTGAGLMLIDAALKAEAGLEETKEDVWWNR